MNRVPQGSTPSSLDAEKVAYWYLRLNGFLQIENFVIHPTGRGGQRTDADLLAVRFPHRAERLIDNPHDIMADDQQGLALSPDLIDVVIAEVKANQRCTLNGPWTKPEGQNVHRVLAAIGCIPPDQIGKAAADIYKRGIHVSNRALRIRLVAVGRAHSDDLATLYPHVVQLTWRNVLDFIWQRFHRYQRQKTQVNQWDSEGKKIKRLADLNNAADFVEMAQRLIRESANQSHVRP